MTKEQLYQELNYVNHSREKRSYYADLLINNPELVSPLLEILFTVNDKISCRAAWIFEFMCSEHINTIIPHLNKFTDNISLVHLDSAVRPVAKVCEILITAYYKNKNPEVLKYLIEKHKEKIIEVCFDWMITNQKVAVKAYSMTTLFFLGQEYQWVYPELKIILERDYELQSAAFKARARRILKKLNKI